MAKARSRRPAQESRLRATEEAAAAVDETDDPDETDAPDETRDVENADVGAVPDDAADADDDSEAPDDEDAGDDPDDEDADDEDADDEPATKAAQQRASRRSAARRKAARPSAAARTRRQRLAELEAVRKQEAKRRSLILLGICVICALGLLAYPVYVFAQDAVLRATPRTSLGVTTVQAGCLPIRTSPASGNQQHVPDGTIVQYDRLPPDSGPHYDHWAPFDTKFYTMADRPEVEVLVHNLEHGYILAWYDVDNMSAKDVKTLKAIASTFNSNDPDSKFIAAPWSVSTDGGSFPDGTHLALSRWTADVDTTTGTVSNQQGVQEFCGQVSGEVIEAFHVKYPALIAPEPDGG